MISGVNDAEISLFKFWEQQVQTSYGRRGCVQESLQGQSGCRPLGEERRWTRGEIRNIGNTQVIAWKHLSVLSISPLAIGRHE